MENLGLILWEPIKKCRTIKGKIAKVSSEIKIARYNEVKTKNVKIFLRNLISEQKRLEQQLDMGDFPTDWLCEQKLLPVQFDHIQAAATPWTGSALFRHMLQNVEKMGQIHLTTLAAGLQHTSTAPDTGSSTVSKRVSYSSMEDKNLKMDLGYTFEDNFGLSYKQVKNMENNFNEETRKSAVKQRTNNKKRKMIKEPRSNKISVKEEAKCVPKDSRENNVDLKDNKKSPVTRTDTESKLREEATIEMDSRDDHPLAKPKEPDKFEMFFKGNSKLKCLTTKSTISGDFRKIGSLNRCSGPIDYQLSPCLATRGGGRGHGQQPEVGEAVVGHGQWPHVGGGDEVQQGGQQQHPGQHRGVPPEEQPLHQHQQQQSIQGVLKEENQKAKKNVLKESHNMQSCSWKDFGNLITKDTKESRKLKTIESITENEIFGEKKAITSYTLQENEESKENAIGTVRGTVDREIQKSRANNEGSIQIANFHKSDCKNEILSCNHRRSFYHRKDMGPIRTGQRKIIKEIISEELKQKESGQDTKNRKKNKFCNLKKHLEKQRRLIFRLEEEKDCYLNEGLNIIHRINNFLEVVKNTSLYQHNTEQIEEYKFELKNQKQRIMNIMKEEPNLTNQKLFGLNVANARHRKATILNTRK